KEVIVTLHSERRGRRRLAIIQTGGRDGSESSWLIHRTKDQPDDAGAPTTGPDEVAPSSIPGRGSPGARLGAPPRPMLATTAAPAELTRQDAAEWAFEAKWDGFRTVVEVLPGSPARVRLASRSGRDLTPTFPELAAIGAMVPDTELPLVLVC